MKKSMMIFLILLLVVLLIGSAVGIYSFISVYGRAQGQALDPATASSREVEAFLVEQWNFQQAELRGKTLTAVRTMDLSFEEACLVGSAVFTDDLSPESYLSQAATILEDVESTFSMEGLTLVLRMESNDDREIFSVDSQGNNQTCWTVEDSE